MNNQKIHNTVGIGVALVIVIFMVIVIETGWGNERGIFKIDNLEDINMASSEKGPTEGLNVDNSDGLIFYTDPNLNFSFKYLPSYKVSVISEGEQEIVLIQKDGGTNGLQVTITPSDDPGPITPALLNQYIPDIRVENDEEVKLKKGIRALAFESDSDFFEGNSYEIWFYQSGYIYQISTYKENMKLAKDIALSIDFNFKLAQ